jgi:hypothetical protein
LIYQHLKEEIVNKDGIKYHINQAKAKEPIEVNQNKITLRSISTILSTHLDHFLIKKGTHSMVKNSIITKA